MAAIATRGANVDHARGQRIAWQKILHALNFKQMAQRPGSTQKTRSRVLIKHGVPASNTAADSPGQAQVFIYDSDNDDVYYCTAWTNSTTFTIVKLSA